MKKKLVVILFVIGILIISALVYLFFATDLFKSKVVCKADMEEEGAIKYTETVTAIIKDDIVKYVNLTYKYEDKDIVDDYCESFKSDDNGSKTKCSGKIIKQRKIKKFTDFDGNNLVNFNKQSFINSMTSMGYTCK